MCSLLCTCKTILNILDIPGLRESSIDKQVDGFVGTESESLSEYPHKLSNGNFVGNEELVFV